MLDSTTGSSKKSDAAAVPPQPPFHQKVEQVTNVEQVTIVDKGKEKEKENEPAITPGTGPKRVTKPALSSAV